MKKTIFAALMIAAISFASCLDEHEEPIDLSLKVGNIYCENGQILPVDYYLMQDVPAAGVVTAVGGPEDNYRALIVSLEDIGRIHYFNLTDEDVSGVSSNLDTMDGKENTAALLYSAVEDSLAHPGAALLCSSYMASGMSAWHLPSVGEFRTVAANFAVISRSLNAVKAQPLGDSYQTSTVDGTGQNNSRLYNYLIELPKGNVTSVIKTEPHQVRPFLMLK